MNEVDIHAVLCGSGAQKLCAAYHEAGHVVGAWISGLPVGKVMVDGKGNGCTMISRFYDWTSMFRKVDQTTVREQMYFLLGGICAEALLPFGDPFPHAEEDRWHARRLARRFVIDPDEVLSKTRAVIERNKHTIALMARDLFKKEELSAFDLALHRMNWLAGGTFSSGLAVSFA